jgi:superfamily I DNA/RNA helicase
VTERIWEEVTFKAVESAAVVEARASDTEQHNVITCLAPGPCLAIAGPGTGKTYCIVERLRYSVSHSWPGYVSQQEPDQPRPNLSRNVPRRQVATSAPGRILVLSFTRRAYNVLSERIGRFPELKERVLISRTKIEMTAAYREAHPQKRRARYVELCSLMANAIREAGMRPAHLEDLVKKAVKMVQEGKPEPSDLGEWLTEKVLSSYAAAKEAAGVFDDGDVAQFVQKDPLAVVKRWKNRGIKVICIEEAQDSSPTEIAIAVAAQQECLEVWCVLDPRQSIYGFRGARVHGLLDGLGRLGNCHYHVLRVNRRSCASVIGVHNDFAGRAFDGELAKPMMAVKAGGVSFHAVECPAKAETLHCLGAALGAIKGLARSKRQAAPMPEPELRRALGLPDAISPAERIAVVLRSNLAAREVYHYLVSIGYAPELLGTDQPAIKEREILYGLLDPTSTSSGVGPAKIYGPASPLCLVLNAIRENAGLRMPRQTPGAQAIDQLLSDLRTGSSDTDRNGVRDALGDRFTDATKKLKAWANNEPPAQRKRSRLKKFANTALSIVSAWKGVLESCPEPCDHPEHLEELLEVAKMVLASRDGKDRRTISLIRDAAKTRNDACRVLVDLIEQDERAQEKDQISDKQRQESQLVVAVAHQTKGAEYNWVLAVALSKESWTRKTLSRGDESPLVNANAIASTDNVEGEEANVWWVLISRAIRGIAYLGVPGNDEFWPKQKNEPEPLD